MMSEARKRANEKWSKENYGTVSCRMGREQIKELRGKLTSHGLTMYTFIRTMCEWCIEGRLDDQLRCMTNQMTREQKNAELDAIVRGR